MAKPVYPYIPNSEPAQKQRLLDGIGIDSVEDIYAEIPDHLRFKGRMNLPEPLLSEYAMKRHVLQILAKNRNCRDNLNFLGGGTWQHHVPSVCDTIIGRDEFLSAYVGDAYSDHGKFQALFEYASMMGELVGMDVVATPTYDWANAAAFCARMASRKNGRAEVVMASTTSPSRLMVIENYLKPRISLVQVAHDPETGALDLEDLRSKVSDATAAVYFENPSFLGFIEMQGAAIAEIAHAAGAELIVGVDPSSLGVLSAPASYGADYVCGDVQPFGIHMQWGAGLSGFMATRDEPDYVAEYPNLLFGITTTTKEGEYGFGEVFYERTSYATREEGKDFVGTTTALYGIIAGVYLALMGPQGMRELGEGIMQRAAYAIDVLDDIPGVQTPRFKSPVFKEFVVNFDGTNRSVRDINKALLDHGVFGGHDLSRDFPELGQSALYCVTEVHTQADIDALATALRAVTA
ncbi:MAG: glycine dehydrogenase subunit 1 [Chloroflexota bacterium]|jgi:glycine dehydrogenase subunit 1|nr:glycine dehydrogenase subunit 1 [Chloroflexota bacterium]